MAEEDDDVVKSVLGALRAYLHGKLPVDKDFFNELDSRRLLASNTARELAQLADQGKQDCVWKLVTFMEQFYTEEMLLKLCAFLEEYAQQARPKLATIASRIRQEISKHKPQVPPPAPEDTLHRSAGVHDEGEVLRPVITPLREEFSELVSEVFFEIKKLNDERMEKLHTFLSILLAPSCVPETVDKMKKYLGVRLNEPLNPNLLEAIVNHLKNDKLTEMMTHYQQTLSKQGSISLSECAAETVQLNVASEEALVSAKIEQNPDQQTLGDVFLFCSFFNSLRIPYAIFRGFKRGCTVLFFSIPTECAWSLPACLLPSNLSLLEEWKVLFFSVKGAFTVDIKERRVVDSLDKHSLLSSLSDYKTLSDDLQQKVSHLKAQVQHGKHFEVESSKEKSNKERLTHTKHEVQAKLSSPQSLIYHNSKHQSMLLSEATAIERGRSSSTSERQEKKEPFLEKIARRREVESISKMQFSTILDPSQSSEMAKLTSTHPYWRQEPDIPEEMWWPTVVCVKDKIFVCARWSYTPHLCVLNVVTRRWSKLRFHESHEKDGTTLATTNNQVHCLGGDWRKDGKVGLYSKIVFTLDCDSLQWSDNTLPPLNVGRVAAASTSFEDIIVVAGGWDEGGQGLSSVEVLDSSQQSSTWWNICDLPVGSFLKQCTVSDTDLFVGCGVGTESTVYSCNLSAVKEAMVPGDSTSPESFWHALPETPLQYSGLAVVNNCLVAVGGSDGNAAYSSAVHLYDTYNKAWTKVSDLRIRRSSPAVVLYSRFENRHELFVFGSRCSRAVTSVESCEVL